MKLSLQFMLKKYVFENGAARPAQDLAEWVAFTELCERRVMVTMLGEVMISTVFLGIDHSFGRGGVAVLYETMIFGTGLPVDEDQVRYTSIDAARRGHIVLVERAREFIPDIEPDTTEYETGLQPAGYEFDAAKIREAIERDL